MTNQAIQDVDWYQTVVTDPQNLSGHSVSEFLRPLIHRVAATAVIAADLQGAGISELKATEGRVLSCDDFLPKVERATQYDWAFFFFYTKHPTPQEADVSDLTAAIQKALVTVRLVDDQYFYVYGRDQDFMNDLRLHYPQAEFRASKFSGLDVPY